MAFKGVALFFIDKKIFLPSHGIFPSGIVVQIEPILSCNLVKTELVDTINIILKNGLKNLPDVTAEEWKNRKDPLLVATKMRSWKKLDINSIYYGLEWANDKIFLSFSNLNIKKRQEVDHERTMTFTHDTNIDEIVEIILDDYSKFIKK